MPGKTMNLTVERTQRLAATASRSMHQTSNRRLAGVKASERDGFLLASGLGKQQKQLRKTAKPTVLAAIA
jgi:hypothetical protein